MFDEQRSVLLPSLVFGVYFIAELNEPSRVVRLYSSSKKFQAEVFQLKGDL